jgi:hypothetical protein
MTRRSLRDRFLTPPVARAIMSPLGMVVFGVGSAASILAGLPVVAALGVGAVAWAGNVARAVPRNPKRDRVEPFVLADPWRAYVVGAQEAKTRFDRVVADMSPGPLRDRFSGLAARLDDGIAESWQIAKRGNDISGALARLDTVRAEAELAQLQVAIDARPAGQQIATSAEARTMEALGAQIDSARRLQAIEVEARDRLRLLDARFDELVARAVEVSVGAGDSALLGNEVDDLVTELESLRVALDETNRAESASELPPPAGPSEQPRQTPSP